MYTPNDLFLLSSTSNTISRGILLHTLVRVRGIINTPPDCIIMLLLSQEGKERNASNATMDILKILLNICIYIIYRLASYSFLTARFAGFFLSSFSAVFLFFLGFEIDLDLATPAGGVMGSSLILIFFFPAAALRA